MIFSNIGRIFKEFIFSGALPLLKVTEENIVVDCPQAPVNEDVVCFCKCHRLQQVPLNFCLLMK
jgi:hypothetical protein